MGLLFSTKGEFEEKDDWIMITEVKRGKSYLRVHLPQGCLNLSPLVLLKINP